MSGPASPASGNDPAVHQAITAFAAEQHLPRSDEQKLDTLVGMTDRYLRRSMKNWFRSDMLGNTPLKNLVQGGGDEYATTIMLRRGGLLMACFALACKGEDGWKIQEMRSDHETYFKHGNRFFEAQASDYYRGNRRLIRSADDDTSQTIESLFPAANDRPRYGKLLADLLTSERYTTVELGKLQSKPDGWFQRLYCQFQKLHYLQASNELARVEAHWKKHLPNGFLEPFQPGEFMVKVHFPENTFVEEVSKRKGGGPALANWLLRWDHYIKDK